LPVDALKLQVKEAFRRGAQIIPVVRSGGAASGLFNFPKDPVTPVTRPEHSSAAAHKKNIWVVVF
jgi:hypothetical protein